MAQVPHVHLPVLLAGPEPSGSSDPSRRCRGCLPPSPASPGSGCPQLRAGCCDSQRAESFHLRSVQKRLVAHDIPAPNLIRSRRPQTRLDPFRMPALSPPLAHLALFGQDPVHR